MAAIHGITGAWIAIGISNRLNLHYPRSALKVKHRVQQIVTRSPTSISSKDTPVIQLVIQL
jgi:hypothetical protein